jgi:hypothetical protein
MDLIAARALLRAMNEWKQQWVRALEVASGALEAVARARALPPDELGARRGRLALERSWLATVDWPRLEIGGNYRGAREMAETYSPQANQTRRPAVRKRRNRDRQAPRWQGGHRHTKLSER